MTPRIDEYTYTHTHKTRRAKIEVYMKKRAEVEEVVDALFIIFFFFCRCVQLQDEKLNYLRASLPAQLDRELLAGHRNSDPTPRNIGLQGPCAPLSMLFVVFIH